MQDRVNAAIENGDYRAAAQLIQAWKQQTPKDPWLALAIARYQEGTGRWEAAEKTYLRALRQGTIPKLMAQARQGIQRVQGHLARAREEALETAKALPGNEAPGLLCLEPVDAAVRQEAAQGLAKVMQVDPYTARMQLPSKEWRLYRLGPIGELQYLGQSLIQAHTPAFWIKHAALKEIQTFRVDYFRSVQPQAMVICQNAQGQLGEISFQWSEVTQAVFGLIPLFESVVDRGPWGKLERKEKTQDYAEVLDLHFHGRRCILRLCDRAYQFRHGNPLAATPPGSNPSPSARPLWNDLLTHIQQQITGPIYREFTSFGEGALEFIDLMPSLPHQVPLSRRQESPWDPAFHLYSGLRFLRYREGA